MRRSLPPAKSKLAIQSAPCDDGFSQQKTRPAFGRARFVFNARRLTAGQYVGADAPGRINRLGNGVVVVAGNDDRIAVRIDATDDADMAAPTAPHHGDGADLRSAHPL